VLRGVNAAAVISNWLRMADNDAFSSIASQVRSSPTELVDELDAALLATASTPSIPMRDGD
jgi:hypothetical protein